MNRAHRHRRRTVRAVDIREPVPAEHTQAFIQVAQGSRIAWHMVRSCGDPAVGSNFAHANELYPFEKVSDRARHYMEAAFEHMLMWSDHAAPFKFHPEQTVNFALRPTYTLARAALESAAQGVWLMDTLEPVECIRRHLCLIRWDLQEHRKSFLDLENKKRIKDREDELLARIAAQFTEQNVMPPQTYRDVVRGACNPDDLDLDADNVERLWRAASGAAHGMYWPNLELQRTTVGEEYEPGHFRTRSVPDSSVMVEVIQAAHKMSQYGAMKYLLFAGADPGALMGPAMRWLAENVTFKSDANPEVLMRMTADRLPDWGKS